MSAVETLSTLTSSTWVLKLDQLQCWLQSTQRGPLLPESRQSYRLYLLNLILGVQSARFALFAALYHIFPAGPEGHPRLPYYLGDALQLLTRHSFYINLGCACAFVYCCLVTTRFHQSGSYDQSKLRWFRVVIYVEAITWLDRQSSQQCFRLLRKLPLALYQKYQFKFARALQFRTICVRCNYLGIVLYFTGIVFRVWQHPEWGHPISVTVGVALFYQLCYYYWFKVILSAQILLYLNSTFVTLLLQAMDQRLTGPVGRREFRDSVRLFNQTCRVLTELNHFWRSPVADYYFFLIPATMICLYVIFFVPTEPFFAALLTYCVALCLSTMYFNNWVAARVRSSASQLYRDIYHRGVPQTTKLSPSDKLKLFNVFQIIGCKSLQFGFQIGTFATANQRVTCVILILMARVFMFLIHLDQLIS